jgi:PBP1b-binding outer membrane lipoprotein LpoB
MTTKLPILILLVFLFTGCFSTIKPSKQIDDNQKVIAKEEKKVDATIVQIEKNEK